MKQALWFCGAIGVAVVVGWALRGSRGLVATASPCAHCAPSNPPAPPPEPEALHERLGPPKPGDWRSAYDEPAQSFEAYASSAANRRCPHRKTIYLQPWTSPPGRLGFSPVCEAAYPQVVERMRVYLGTFYGVDVALLPPIPLDPEAFNAERDQYDADRLTHGLAGRVPEDALALVGLTKEDLYSSNLNFVFGVGSLSQRAGAYSMRRLQTAKSELFLDRGLKLIVHETGHILSIPHCVEWRCVMQGANSVSDQDGQPLRLCPSDLRKAEWNLGFDRVERYRSLLKLHRDYGLQAEIPWLESRLKP